jgi:hypothetical protein
VGVHELRVQAPLPIANMELSGRLFQINQVCIVLGPNFKNLSHICVALDTLALSEFGPAIQTVQFKLPM